MTQDQAFAPGGNENGANETVITWALGAQGSALRLLDGARGSAPRALVLGVDALVHQCLAHAPPTPLELEHAIELVEHAVMPLAPWAAGASLLRLEGPGARILAQGLAAQDPPPEGWSLEQVEALFSRLVALSQGRPPSQDTLPVDAPFYACMLLVREAMHHLALTRLQCDLPKA